MPDLILGTGDTAVIRSVQVLTLIEFTFQWDKLINKLACKGLLIVSAVKKTNRTEIYVVAFFVSKVVLIDLPYRSV